MRLKPTSTPGTGQWQAHTLALQQASEHEAEGRLSDSPLSAIESPEVVVVAGPSKGKASTKKQQDVGRKRAHSDLSSDAPAQAQATNKKKKATVVIDSDDGGEQAGSSPNKKKQKSSKDDGKPPGPLKGRKMRKGEPYDPNRHCGVPHEETGKPCGRSLTCKTHSMGAKRSVVGRSAPYDILLHEWQKLHNPNFGDRKVVTPRVGPGIPAGGTKKKKSGGGAGGSGAYSSSEPARLAAGGSLAGDEEGGQPGVGPNGLTTWDEAVLGEVDADFVPSAASTNAAAAMVLAASMGRGGGAGSSSSKKAARGAAMTEEAMALEEAEDSDDEADLVMRAVAASAGGKPLVEGPAHAMGSWWMTRWNRFGRWGTREAYREAFRLGAGGGTGQAAAGGYGR